MDFFCEKHESASIGEDLYGWIEISSENNYKFIEEPSTLTNRINRYVIELYHVKEFIEHLKINKTIYFCCYLKNKSKGLTKVQKLFKQKTLLKYGFTEASCIDDLYYKEVRDVGCLNINIADDSYYDSIFLFSNDKLNESELVKNLRQLDFFIQPEEMGNFYPTYNFAEYMILQDVGIMYLLKHYYYWNREHERNVFVSYSAQRI